MKSTKRRVRAVIDTNLYVSGFFATEGITYLLQELWVNGAFELAISEKILAEIDATLAKPHIRKKLHLNDADIEEIIGLIREKALIVTDDSYQTDAIKKDPDDNKFLACAMESKAHYLVSGDNHLLELKHFHGVQIVDAKSFVRLVSKNVQAHTTES